MKLEHEHKKLVKAYLVLKCLEAASFSWVAASYVLFLLERGLIPEQTTQVNIVFMVVNFFCDLPTGALADILGQIPVYLAGTFIHGLGTALYGTGHSFLAFALCEGTVAVGTSLMSEALEAFITNELGNEAAKKVFSTEGVYTKFASIPPALLGSIIATNVGIAYPWFFGGLTALAGVIYGGITLRKYHIKPEHNCNNAIEHVQNILRTIKLGTKIVFSKKETILAVLISGGVAFATQAPNMFWAPVLKHQAGETWWLGIFWVGISLTTAFGAYWARHLRANPINFAWMLCLIGIPLVIATYFPDSALITTVMFLVHEIGRGALPILLYSYMNCYIPDTQRSTANSANGSVGRAFRALGLLLAGILSTKIPLINTWDISGLVLVGGAGLVAVYEIVIAVTNKR